MGTEGFISVVNDIKMEQSEKMSEGSPIFRLKNDMLTPVQYFMRPRQKHINFLQYNNDLFIWQTYRNDNKSDEKSNCPILKWNDGTFNEIDQIPCTNAKQLQVFTIENQVYVAVANYMDENENIETHSAIYQIDMNTRTFNLIQTLKTFGAVDIKYAQIGEENFLFVANSFHVYHSSEVSASSNGVIYRFEHMKFVPAQILPFDAEVTQFLPYFVSLTFFY